MLNRFTYSDPSTSGVIIVSQNNTKLNILKRRKQERKGKEIEGNVKLIFSFP